MLVYGVRCSPIDLSDLPTYASADYYLDYSLLVFPSYTKPTCLKSTGSSLSPIFWSQVGRIVQHPRAVSEIQFEQPWITDEEHDIIVALQNPYPGIQSNWYYVPKVVTQSG